MSDHGHHHDDAPKLYGVIAEFNEADDVLHAAEKAYKAGYRNMDAYSPYPVHGLSDRLVIVHYENRRRVTHFGLLSDAAAIAGSTMWNSAPPSPARKIDV